MLRDLRSTNFRRLLLAALATTFWISPSGAIAGFKVPYRGPSQMTLPDDCHPITPQPGRYYCLTEAVLEDPLANGVTGFTLALQTDPSEYIFNPSTSGPLGAFSVGGDTPPPNPGVGTELLQILPSSGFTPGAPLPGSTLTYTDVGGLLTVNYQFATPVTVSGDVNFFLIDYTLVRPIIIQLGVSSATYATSGPGADISLGSFSCGLVDPSGGCGSDFPSTGITFNNVGYLPEPTTWLMMLAGFGVSGAKLRRRRWTTTPTTSTPQTSPILMRALRQHRQGQRL